MSEQLTFADMLNHYSLKMTEVSDYASAMVTYLNKSVAIANENWTSMSSEVFNEQIMLINNSIGGLNQSLDTLMSLLNAVKNETLDSQVQQLEEQVQDNS